MRGKKRINANRELKAAARRPPLLMKQKSTNFPLVPRGFVIQS